MTKVDSSKRRTLVSMGAIAALPLVPSLASAATASAQTDSSTTTQSLQKAIQQTNADLEIQLLLDGDPTMRVTNTSNKLSIVRRIHPGVVHVGNKSYDLNHSLMSSAYAIGAGKSRLIPVAEALGPFAEPAPTQRNGKSLRTASISGDNTSGRMLRSSRVFYS